MTIRANVHETGQGLFAVRVETGDHILIADEPEDAGGSGLGPAPYELLLSALGACTAMTVRWYAREKNWPLARVEVAITYERKMANGAREVSDVFTKAITLYGDSLTPEQRRRLIEVAEKCPVQQTLQRTPIIVTTEQVNQEEPSAYELARA